MKISYDLETDSLYIQLLEGQYECRTLRLHEEVALNIGPGETLIGIEILAHPPPIWWATAHGKRRV